MSWYEKVPEDVFEEVGLGFDELVIGHVEADDFLYVEDEDGAIVAVSADHVIDALVLGNVKVTRYLAMLEVKLSSLMLFWY